MPQFLEFDNVLNARDFGGYDGAHGRLADGKLLRTAHLAAANDKDLEKLRDLDARLIVDLRYLSERERQPNRWPDGHEAVTLAFDANLRGAAPHESFVEHDLHSPDDAITYMLGSYKQRPHEAAFKDVFSKTLSHMAQTGQGVIVHCAAGKDRTGTLVALIQSLLGMHADDIMADYMATMQAVDIDAILKMATPQIEQRYGRDYDVEALRPLFGVREDYLRASLDAMGSPHEYAYDVLGLTREQHDDLIANYTA